TAMDLIIIADDLEGDALSTLVMNKLRGTLKVAAIKAPGFGDRRKAMLEDLAILTGGELISEEKGMNLRDADIDCLGSCDLATIGKEKTTIVGGKGAPTDIKGRISQIESEIKLASSSYDKEKLEERKAKLQGGVAVIKVGAPTESEMKKKKQMYEDSLNSTRAALEEGVVAGGGITLLHASKKAFDRLKLNQEEEIGAKILLKACESPFKQIAFNAGFDGSLLLEEVLKAGKNVGFNAMTEKVEDLLTAGVIDPVKVVKNSLIYAVSIAGVVLLSECLMADEPEAVAK
ncbi:MAG TPA: chaperonin GroEL, partial [Chlamydiales bacterium]|nr:chaperonin GroEL [Chlamydiales bacterium]